jgi:hypothetical protein
LVAASIESAATCRCSARDRQGGPQNFAPVTRWIAEALNWHEGARIGFEGCVAVSDDVADPEAWLITHPEFRAILRSRATADYLKRIAQGSNGLM